MEHVFKGGDNLPMYFVVNTKEKIVEFATESLVMPGDTLAGCGIKGTVKEILDEHESRGRWTQLGYKIPPTWYKVLLY